jgi:hypothetical protein
MNGKQTDSRAAKATHCRTGWQDSLDFSNPVLLPYRLPNITAFESPHKTFQWFTRGTRDDGQRNESTEVQF